MSLATNAGVRSRTLQELARVIARKARHDVTEEGLETLAARLSARYGDDARVAAQKVGPSLEALLDVAGDTAPLAVRLLARRGDDALWVVRRPAALRMIRDLPEDAADAFLRHKSVAQHLMAQHGRRAVDALRSLDLRNGRRVAIMLDAGDLHRIGHTPERWMSLAGTGIATWTSSGETRAPSRSGRS